MHIHVNVSRTRRKTERPLEEPGRADHMSSSCVRPWTWKPHRHMETSKQKGHRNRAAPQSHYITVYKLLMHRRVQQSAWRLIENDVPMSFHRRVVTYESGRFPPPPFSLFPINPSVASHPHPHLSTEDNTGTHLVVTVETREVQTQSLAGEENIIIFLSRYIQKSLTVCMWNAYLENCLS